MQFSQKVMNLTLLATVLFSPAAMAQSTTRIGVDGNPLKQQLPCFNEQGKPIRCPWEVPPIRKPINGDTHVEKKPNPCNPKGGEPVDPKKCRDYILGNPTPKPQPKP